jgi:hypothetical protein
MVGGHEWSTGVGAGRQAFASEKALHDTARPAASSQGRDGGSGTSSARGGGGPHGGTRGK